MDTLFHYCSSATFASIISRKSIWLSSLSLSNDTMEGRLVAKTFDRLLAQAPVSSEEADNIRRSFEFTEGMCDGLGFCMSEKPDLLSQWRGYADDGYGFSIGFNKAYLEELRQSFKIGDSTFRLLKVLYRQEDHDAALKPTYEKIKELIDAGGLRFPQFGLINWPGELEVQKKTDEHKKSLHKLWAHSAGIVFGEAHKLKSDAFAEEAEWRLVSLLLGEVDDEALFRPVRDRLVPYREFDLKVLPTRAISEVYVGPKNITPVSVIVKFLRLNGFIDVAVKRSSATYR